MLHAKRSNSLAALSFGLIIASLLLASVPTTGLRGPSASVAPGPIVQPSLDNSTGNATNNSSDCNAYAANYSNVKPSPIYSVNWAFESDYVVAFSLTTPTKTVSGGVPGVDEYCVYGANGDTSTMTGETTPVVIGGHAWKAQLDCKSGMGGGATDTCAQALRPTGNPTNIPDDGATREVLDVTYNVDPNTTTWTIVLHIQDLTECSRLFGPNTSGCFVSPAVGSAALPLSVSTTANASSTLTYSWNVSKSANATWLNIPLGGSASVGYNVTVTHDTGTYGNWVVAGSVTLTNPNAANVTDVSVVEALNDTNATCVVAGVFPATVPASGSITFLYTCTYSAAPANGTDEANATASWPAQTLSNGRLLAGGSASASASVAWSLANVSLVDDSVTVSDTLGGALGTVLSTDPASVSFLYNHSFTGDPGGTCTRHNNTATFVTNDTATEGNASRSVTVCVGVDLTVTKNATASFTRTYDWAIEKSASPPSQTVLEGTNATFDYNVSVEQTGYTDSDWAVTGTINVTNPNDWEAISADIADAVNDGGNCSVVGGANVTVPAGSSIELAYSCTYASEPSAGTGTNNATATWNASAFSTPDSTASGEATFVFDTPTTVVDQQVTVNDTLLGGATVTLGNVTANDTAPFASIAFSYSRNLTAPAGSCTIYTNTAELVETGQNASANVTLCVVPPATVTNSDFCAIVGNQTNLIFISSSLGYQLRASNPGQFYENVFFVGQPGDTVSVTLQIPYPFVTSGAHPIQLSGTQLYDPTQSPCLVPDFAENSLLTSVTGTTASGEPLSTVSASGYLVVTLAAYDVVTPAPAPIGTFTTLNVTGTIPSSGLFYLTVHLDYGLKGTAGWSVGPAGCKTSCNAVGSNPAVTLLYGQVYEFGSVVIDTNTSTGFAQTPALSTVNTFKKDPGFAGEVTDQSGNPVSGIKVQILDSKGKLLATVYTDADGFYSYAYKWTGKATTFTVRLPVQGISQTVLMKSNSQVIVDFTV